VDKANEKTFSLAKNREQTTTRWHRALSKASNEVMIQNEIPKPKKGFFPGIIMKPSHFKTVKKVTHAVMRSFKELDIIGKKAKAVFEKDHKNKLVNVGIIRCSKYEKSIFHQAISEVLGPIDNPRYVLVRVRKGKLDPRAAFAVPEVFAGKKQNAEVFQQRMNRRIADFEVHSTRTNDGKKILPMVRKA
jgi:hypothetical protein